MVTLVILLGVYIERQKDSLVSSGVLVSKTTGEPVKVASSLFTLDETGALIPAWSRAFNATSKDRDSHSEAVMPPAPIATSQVTHSPWCASSRSRSRSRDIYFVVPQAIKQALCVLCVLCVRIYFP